MIEITRNINSEDDLCTMPKFIKLIYHNALTENRPK